MFMKEVTIYSTPTCHFCHMAKDFFAEKGVAFTDFNVASDAEKRKEMLDLTGQMGVPVIKIGDDIMVGFNRWLLSNLLGIEE